MGKDVQVVISDDEVRNRYALAQAMTQNGALYPEALRGDGHPLTERQIVRVMGQDALAELQRETVAQRQRLIAMGGELQNVRSKIAYQGEQLSTVQRGLTSVTGRVTNLEDAHVELKGQVEKIVSGHNGTKTAHKIGLILGAIVGLLAGIWTAVHDFTQVSNDSTNVDLNVAKGTIEHTSKLVLYLSEPWAPWVVGIAVGSMVFGIVAVIAGFVIGRKNESAKKSQAKTSESWKVDGKKHWNHTSTWTRKRNAMGNQGAPTK